ncbi:MAG TPA: hypothetical protein PKO03_03030 [Anaerolineaceae bacterium]|nr:hypothetical protein [Anaerolineaceae bacterium]
MKKIMESLKSLMDRHRLVSAGLFLFVIAVFYIFIWNDAPYLQPDSIGYMEVAQNLVENNVSTIFERVPFYPLLILLTGSAYQPSFQLFLFQLIGYFISIFLVFVILEKELPYKMALVFLSISVFPPFVEYATYVMTEATTTMLILFDLAFFYWAIKKRNIASSIAVGIISGILPLIRPTFQLIPLLLLFLFLCAIFFYKEKRIFLYAVIAIMISSIFIVGYAFINYKSYGYFGLTPLQGFNLSTKTMPYIERIPEHHKVIRDVLLEFRNGSLVKGQSHSGVMYIWDAIPKLLEVTSMNIVQLSKLLQDINISLIIHSPLSYILEVGKAIAAYVLPATTDVANFNNSWVQLLWLIGNFLTLFVFILCISGIIGCLILIPLEKLRGLIQEQPIFLIALFSIVFILYNLLISTAFEVGNPRYRVPTDLLTFIYILVQIYTIKNIKISISFNTWISPSNLDY